MYYFSPSKFYELAKELLDFDPDKDDPKDNIKNHGIDETKIRTVMGRAYYAAFLNVAEIRGFDTKQENAHKKLHEDLVRDFYFSGNKEEKKKRKKLINHLEQLRVARQQSDYHMDRDMSSYVVGANTIYLSNFIIQNRNELKKY